MDTEENDFQLRIGKTARDRGPRLGQIQGAIGRVKLKRAPSKMSAGGGPRPGLRAHFVKGSKASPHGREAPMGQRRVVVKARVVSHASGAGALKAHVSYLARESRTKENAPAPQLSNTSPAAPELSRQVDYLAREGASSRYEFYDQATDSADAKSLTAGWVQDVRHFRLIISPEDGAALGDLKPFVREVMTDLNARLGGSLEWLGVDHWDTDNPHSHVLIRGKRADGMDLIIPRRVISYEIRLRAQEIATRILGPRPEVAIDHARAKDVALEGLTPLDREIIAAARADILDPPARGRTDLTARLQQLEVWNLVARHPDGRWALAPKLKDSLQALGERAEIVRMLGRVHDLTRSEYDILQADTSMPAVGKVVHTGIVDELTERVIAVIEDEGGRLRYAGFERSEHRASLDGVLPGAIVEFSPAKAQERPADQAVARIAELSGGKYSADLHFAAEPAANPALVAGNVKRLESLRRAGLVERHQSGIFEIAPDHRERALKFEQSRLAKSPVVPRVLSYWTLGEQAHAFGPTQLDQILAGQSQGPEGPGRIVREFKDALQERRMFLIEEGYMTVGARNLSRTALDRLAKLEVRSVANSLETELGRRVITNIGDEVNGVYARRIDLAQGRYALLMNKETAALVPWRPALEQFAGRHVEGLVRGRSISWALYKGRGPSLPPL